MSLHCMCITNKTKKLLLKNLWILKIKIVRTVSCIWVLDPTLEMNVKLVNIINNAAMLILKITMNKLIQVSNRLS